MFPKKKLRPCYFKSLLLNAMPQLSHKATATFKMIARISDKLTRSYHCYNPQWKTFLCLNKKRVKQHKLENISWYDKTFQYKTILICYRNFSTSFSWSIRFFFTKEKRRKVAEFPIVIIKRIASRDKTTDISLTLLNDPSLSSRCCLSQRKSTLRGLAEFH